MIYETRVKPHPTRDLQLDVVGVGTTYATSLACIDEAVFEFLALQGIVNAEDAVVLPVKMMQVPEFKAQQDEMRYAPHVKQLNMMVNKLVKGGERGWMPWIAPWQGGVNAQVLAVSRDPGPRTKQSQYLCMQNADESAAGMTMLAEKARLKPSDITPWNCYPWYINRTPTSGEIRAGLSPLAGVVAAMGNLKAILLHGRQAQEGWDLLVSTEPALRSRFPESSVFRTYHSGRQALRVKEPERSRRRSHRIATYQQIAALLRGDAPSPLSEIADCSPGALTQSGETVVASDRERMLTVSTHASPYAVYVGERQWRFDKLHKAIAAFEQN